MNLLLWSVRAVPHWLKWAFLALIVLVLLGLCSWWGVNSYFRLRVNSELGRLRAGGYPTTAEEVRALYPEIEEEQDPTALLEKAIAHLPQEKAESTLADSVHEIPLETDIEEEVLKSVGEMLTTQSECLQLVRRITAMPKARFPLRIGDDLWDIDAPHLSQLRRVMNLLFLDAVLAGEEGRQKDAVGNLVDELELGKLLEPEHFVISQLTRISSIRDAKHGTERILAHVTLDDDSLRSLVSGFAESETSQGLSRALAAEACAAYLYCDEIFETSMDEMVAENTLQIEGESGADSIATRRNIMEGVFLNPNRFTFVEGYRKLIEAGRLPMHLRDGAAEAAMDALEDWPWPWRVLSSLMLPSLSRVYWADGVAAAEVRVTTTSLAIERYRLAHGKRPNGIADLVPEFLDAIPEDPFDGKALRYQQLETGFIVYSVGANGKDDDGSKEPDPRRKRYTRDIVFRVIR